MRKWTLVLLAVLFCFTATANPPIKSTFIGDSGLDGADFSVNLDGAAEYYTTINTTEWNYSNAWSYSYWAKPDPGATTEFVLDMRNSSTTNSGRTLSRMLSETSFEVRIYFSDVQKKQYQWDDLWGNPFVPAWQHHVITWDGVNLRLYVDSILTVENTRVDDDAGTMLNPSRRLQYGAGHAGAFPWAGNLGHLGLWSVVLDQNDINEIFAGKFSINLLSNTGTYDESASLLSYYRPGYSPAGVGIGDTDEGSNAIDFTGVNITSADIQAEAP